METARTIYQRIIDNAKLEEKQLKAELKTIPKDIAKLQNYLVDDKIIVFKVFNIKLYHPHTYPKREVKAYHPEFANESTDLIRLQTILTGIVLLQKRIAIINHKLDELKLIRAYRNEFSMIVRFYFDGLVKKIVYGEKVSIGKGLQFKMVYSTIDNSDGKSRMNYAASNEKRMKLLEAGIPIQNHSAGQYGEQWVVTYDNKITIGTIHFSKLFCHLKSIAWYMFKPLNSSVPGVIYENLNPNTPIDILNYKLGLKRKIRLIDKFFPEHKFKYYHKGNYKE